MDAIFPTRLLTKQQPNYVEASLWEATNRSTTQEFCNIL
jgi:hypothetical protein